MGKDRKRNSCSIEPKRVILIACEGNNKTERNYFNGFASREKNYNIKMVPGNETDPVNLVKQTIEKAHELALNLSENDKAYCVFDTDTNVEKNKQILAALNLSFKNNITPVVSAPCIEIWFLLHFEYSTAFVSNTEVLEKLKMYYPKYAKNCDIYDDIKDKVLIAINNSKKLERFHLQNNTSLKMVEANPSTEVYKIVEELLK